MICELMELQVKAVASYRLKKIEVKSGDAIDQIKFVYDDGTVWRSGHDGGKTDQRCLIMTAGEYLVRVTHERLFNFKCAGAAVEFETNKGRIFSYQPLEMATKWKTEQVTINATSGNEIICLTIRRGILVGSEQQPVPTSNIAPCFASWYVIATIQLKENDFICDAQRITYNEYFNKVEALERWRVQELEMSNKRSRATILIDCMKSSVVKTQGHHAAIQICVEKAMEAGYCTQVKEGDFSITELFLTLCKLLGRKEDLLMFTTIVCLLFFSFWLNLESQLLAGHMLSIVTSSNISLKHNRYTVWMCKYILPCDQSHVDTCKAIIVSFVLVKVFEMLLYVLNVYIYQLLCDTKNHQLRCDVFSHLLSLDQSYFDTHSSSEIRGSMNVSAMNNLICWNIPYFITLTIRYIMVAYYLILIDPYLGGAFVFCMLVIKFGLLHTAGKFERDVHKMAKKLDMINCQIVDEVLNMIKSVKLFSKERYHIDEHDTCQERVIKNLNISVVLRCVREFIYGLLKAVTFAGVVYYGLGHIRKSELSAGELTGFFLLLQQFQDLMSRLKWHHEVLTREFRDIDRFFTLKKERPSILDGHLKPDDLMGDIEFNDVFFSYPSRPGEEVISGLNVRISPNKMTAIVGDSGAGKTTVANLLMRLYDPSSGSITIDGYDIRHLDKSHLHKFVAVVNQTPQLFDLSLAENIGYGVSQGEFSIDQVVKVAKLANCGFISKFRGGFDTFAGSSGSQLSGGEKQRIAIARALIRNPKILILDEATSSLDAENEQQLHEALEKVMKGRTMIVIAHRLSTIRNADDIICMKDGKMVERGSHRKLMEMGGTYYNLILKQVTQMQL